MMCVYIKKASFLIILCFFHLVYLVRSDLLKPPVVLGIDVGTESLRAAIFDNLGNCISSSVSEYKSGTSFPKNGWAEQNPDDWWSSMKVALKDVLSKAGEDHDVAAISIDTTACSVVALEENNNGELSPLRPCLLWMDVRASRQCETILIKGKVKFVLII